MRGGEGSGGIIIMRLGYTGCRCTAICERKVFLRKLYRRFVRVLLRVTKNNVITTYFRKQVCNNKRVLLLDADVFFILINHSGQR